MHSSHQPEMSSSTSNLFPSSAADTTEAATALYAKLKSAPEKNQLQLVQELQQAGENGLSALMQFLLEHQNRLSNDASQPKSYGTFSDLVAGAAYQALFQANFQPATEFLQTHLPEGIIPLRSEVGVDYSPVQQLLAQQDFLAADKVTLQKMCELAGPAAVQRKWLYFTEVDQFPVTDLQTINALWWVHSAGKFGFSVQREIWLSVGKDWEKLWSKIGWKDGNNWTRYPQEFTWNLTAPNGHLPLSNQLRGVRVIAGLFAHPAWSK